MNDARHTTIINSEQPVSEVRFAAADDGRWFRVLNWLVDSGEWARLSGVASRTLLVLARHRGSDGTSLPSQELIEAQSGLSRAGVFKGLGELRTARLIERTGSGAWMVFPGREFAGRVAGRDPNPRAWTGAPPQSTVVDKQSTAVDCQSTAVDPLLRLRDQDVGAHRPPAIPAGPVDAAVAGPERAAVVALLRKEGFGDKDIERFGSTVSLQQLRGYVANADEIERRGKPWRSSRRAYLAGAMRDGYGLYANVERQLTRERAPELREKLEDIVLARLDESREDHRSILEVYGTATGTLERGGVTARELDSLGADEVFDLLLVRAKAKAAARRCRR